MEPHGGISLGQSKVARDQHRWWPTLKDRQKDNVSDYLGAQPTTVKPSQIYNTGLISPNG